MDSWLSLKVLYPSSKRQMSAKNSVKTKSKREASPEPASEGKTRRKKRSRDSFKIGIYRVLKQVHPDTRISAIVSEQMDSFCKVVSTELSTRAREFATLAKRSTINSRDVQSAVRAFIPGELCKHSVGEGTKAVTKFNVVLSHKDERPQRREIHAGLKVSVALCEKHLRDFGNSGMSIGRGAPVYLTGVVEYLIAEIMELAGNAAKDHKVETITSRHLGLAVMHDQELAELFNSMNMSFCGGGVVPHIRTELLPKAKKAKKGGPGKTKNGESTAGVTVPHRFRPGTKSLRLIRKYQKTTGLLLLKDPFERIVRECAASIRDNTRFNPNATLAIQAYAESRVVDLASDSMDLGIHAGRDTLFRSDIDMIVKLKYPGIMHTGNYTHKERFSNNGIERLLYRAGVKRKSNMVYGLLNDFMVGVIYQLLMSIEVVISSRRVITVHVEDVRNGLKQIGQNFLIPNKIKTK